MNLSRAVLCPDCNEVFEIEKRTCPRCGSRQWASLARWLHERAAKAG